MEDHLKCAYLLKDICQSLGALAYDLKANKHYLKATELQFDFI